MATEPNRSVPEIAARARDLASSAQFTSTPHRGYEKRDANAKWIFAVVLFLLVAGLIIHGLLAWFLAVLEKTPAPRDQLHGAERADLPRTARRPFPALQVSPPLDLQSFRTKEEQALNSYGWINRTSGVIRIPITNARELILQEGLPRSEGSQSKAKVSSYELIRQRPDQRAPQSQ